VQAGIPMRSNRDLTGLIPRPLGRIEKFNTLLIPRQLCCEVVHFTIFSF